MPKGYYYYDHAYSYPSDLWPGNTEFSVRKDGEATLDTNVGYLLDDYKTPSASDRTPTGKLNINISSLGHRTYNKYRVYKAYCIAFKPNTRIFSYNANGGTGTVANTKYVYGDSGEESGMIVASNGFTKSGYKFIKWNTEADGSGDDYIAGNPIPENKWPNETSNVTLYAQWGKSATIKYVETNDAGDKEIKTASVNCSLNSNNKCIANIPRDVLGSLGYAGLASTTGTMDTVIGNKDNTIDLTDTSGSVKYYAVYSTPVTNYYRDH